MNVDKFGHHVHKRLRVSDISEFNHKALLRTENGDFDLQSARLKGVEFPVSPKDAVNKQYFHQFIKNLYERKTLDSLFETINNQIKHILLQLKLNFYTSKEIDDILKRLSDGNATDRK
jgi:hypothetical protein